MALVSQVSAMPSDLLDVVKHYHNTAKPQTFSYAWILYVDTVEYSLITYSHLMIFYANNDYFQT